MFLDTETNAGVGELVPAAYFTLDASGIIKEVNLLGARLLGVERARLLQFPFAEYLLPESNAPFSAHLKKVVQEKNCQTGEIKIRGTNRVFDARIDSLCVFYQNRF